MIPTILVRPIPMLPLLEKRLAIPGFNACIIPQQDGYLGLSRVCVQHSQRGVYPEATNNIVMFTLNSEYDVISTTELKDTTNRTIHKSWTQGIEDPRLLSSNRFTAVTCDTNTRWKPEMSIVTFSMDITSIMPLCISDKENEPQKNWLYLNSHTEELHDYLYSSFPFSIIRVNMNTGKGYIIKEESTPGYNIVTHNGAVVKTSEGYLLTVRVKQGYSYHYSLWVKLDDNYNFIQVSKPFRFITGTHLNDDGTFVPGGYEMCMSLHMEKNELVVCVSIDDADNFIQKYDIADINNMFQYP